jgi:L-fuconolactonase
MAVPPDVPLLNHRFALAEYQAQTAEMPVTGMIVVEADVAPQFALLDIQWLTMLTQQEPRIQGRIAAAPVEYGARLQGFFDALSSQGSLVKGVWRNLQSERDPTCCVQPDFVAGVKLLANYGFSFDLCIRSDQLSAVTALVQHCPEVVFILDHLGNSASTVHRLEK